MVLTKVEIEKLLPHRAPFLFVDEILSSDKDTIIGTQTFDEEDEAILLKEFPIPYPIILESMAQCGGAGIRSIGQTNGLFALAYLEYANYISNAYFGDKIQYEVKNIRMSEKMLKQSGKAYINGVLIVEAAWMCVKISEI